MYVTFFRVCVSSLSLSLSLSLGLALGLGLGLSLILSLSLSVILSLGTMCLMSTSATMLMLQCSDAATLYDSTKPYDAILAYGCHSAIFEHDLIALVRD